MMVYSKRVYISIFHFFFPLLRQNMKNFCIAFIMVLTLAHSLMLRHSDFNVRLKITRIGMNLPIYNWHTLCIFFYKRKINVCVQELSNKSFLQN